MKKVIRLTESDLHHIIKNTVKRVLKENANNKYLMLGIIQNNEEGYDSMEDFAKDYLHNASFDDLSGAIFDNMPKYHKFIESYGGVDMYYDYGADYYFFVASDELLDSFKEQGMLDDIETY